MIESDAAFTPAQLGEAAALKGKLEALQAGSTVIGPIPSEDAKAVQFVVPIASSAASEGQSSRNCASEVRASAPEGMQTFVTGPAGLTADLVSAFAGIDGILLLVALGAVFLILLIVYRSLLLPDRGAVHLGLRALRRHPAGVRHGQSSAGSSSTARARASCPSW